MPKTHKKRQSEIANQQERLLNAYLAGTIEQEVFQEKVDTLKSEAEDVKEQLTEATGFEQPNMAEKALKLLKFSQNLAEIWNGSNSAQKREILESISLNRTVSDVSLYIAKRKPLNFLQNQAAVQSTRGDRT